MKKLLLALILLLAIPAWATYPTEYLIGNPTFFYEDDEFISGTTTSGEIGKQGWVTVVDAGTAVVSLGLQTNRPGSIRLTNDTPSSTRLCLKDCTATTGIFNYSDDFDTTAIISFPTYGRPSYLGYYMSNFSTSVLIGLTNNGNASDTFWAVCAGCTPTNTGVAITSNTWYKLRMKKTGSSVEFYINDTLKATLTTTASGVFQPIFFNSWSTTQRYIEVDYWNFIIPSVAR